MKKSMKLLALPFLLFMMLFIVSCSDDDDNSNDNTNPDLDTLFIKFTHDGTMYDYEDPETINSLAKAISYNTFDGNDAIQIVLYMPLNPVVGTHLMTDEPSNVESYGARYTNQVTGIEMTATTGTMIISEVTDEFVKGTFAFSGPNEDGSTVQVSNGSFTAFN